MSKLPLNPDATVPLTPDTLPDDLPGKTLGDFHLIRMVGKGGMGQVYLAEQRSLKRKVALKLLRVDPGNTTQRQRFKLEAEASARLTHPNIVQVYAVGEQDGLSYIALEYVEGSNLASYLANKGALPVPVAVTILRQVAAALQEAHEAGIVHRDIKPANVLLTRKGTAKVTDFGLARCQDGDAPAKTLTRLGSILGTPAYMSPEQAKGSPVDQRTDIYSLGVTCYHMLAGRPPYRGESSLDVLFKHIQEPPTSVSEIRPDVPADLVAIVEKMMAKELDKRYRNAGQLIDDVNRLGNHPAASRPLLEPVRSRVRVVGLAVLGLLLALGVLVFALGGGNSPKESTSPVAKAVSPTKPAAPPDNPPPKPPPGVGGKPAAQVATLLEVLHLKDKNDAAREKAIRALGRLGPHAKDAVPALANALADKNTTIRERAAEALRDIGPAAKEAVPALIEALKDPDDAVREESVRALGRIGPDAKAAVSALVETLKDKKVDVRKSAIDALKLIDLDGTIQKGMGTPR